MKHRALFLDRDGTIIEDRGYMRDPADVHLLPGATDALKDLAAQGWTLIVISNQSGIARGLITPAKLTAVHQRFLELMTANGVPITASYFCTHLPGAGCECRKPSPHFLLEAARDHNLDLARSWMVGDREGDILCGRNAGCSTIWLRNPTFPVAEEIPTLVASHWSEVHRRLSGG